MRGHAFVELGPDDAVTIELQHVYGPIVPGAELVVRCGRSTPIRVHLDNLGQLAALHERIAEVLEMAAETEPAVGEPACRLVGKPH